MLQNGYPPDMVHPSLTSVVIDALSVIWSEVKKCLLLDQKS